MTTMPAHTTCPGCGSLVTALPDRHGTYRFATIASHGCPFDGEPCTNTVTAQATNERQDQ